MKFMSLGTRQNPSRIYPLSLASYFILLYFLAVPDLSAAAGGPHGDEGIPWKALGWQIFNLTLLFSVLIYFLGSRIQTHFRERRNTYIDLVQRAEKARLQAEASKQDLSRRLQALETESREAIRRAERDAQALRESMMTETKLLVAKMKSESDAAIAIELGKARERLKSEFFDEVLRAAQKNLVQELNGAEQGRLQTEFVSKIQVV